MLHALFLASDSYMLQLLWATVADDSPTRPGTTTATCLECTLCSLNYLLEMIQQNHSGKGEGSERGGVAQEDNLHVVEFDYKN